MSAIAENSDAAEDFVHPTAVHVLFAIYLSTLWLTPAFNVPFGAFQGIPADVVLVPLMLVIQGRRAVMAALTIAAVLFTYEFCKNFQSDYHETVKGILGIMALSALFPTIYFALASVLRCPPKFVGKWLTYTLALEFAAIAVENVLGPLGLIYSKYPHYFLPIHSYSGFFEEPSHVAMAMSPFLIMATFDIRLFRRYLGMTGIWCLVGIVLLCSSATEFGILAMAMVALAVKKASQGQFFSLLAGAGVMGAAGVAVLSVRKIQARVFDMLVPQTALMMTKPDAISNLALLKGLEMAQYALQHMPLGVAFLDMASLSNHARISHISRVMAHINSSDGASVLFKGVSEFGYAFLAFVLFAVVRIAFHLWRYDRTSRHALQSLLVVSFEFAFLTMFIRSASYFFGTTAIAMALLVFPSPRLLFSLPRRQNREEMPEGASLIAT